MINFFEWLSNIKLLDKYEAALDISEDYNIDQKNRLDATEYVFRLNEQYIKYGKESNKFIRVTLDDVLKSDSNGMPVFRKCFEHETLLSFYDDSGNYAFKDWWDVEGSLIFNEWFKKSKYK